MTPTIKRFNFMKITLILTFLMGILFTSCSKKDDTPAPPPVDKTTLKATVAAAQALYDGTVEGTKPDQYEAGSKAALKTVLDAAKTVDANGAATQADVTNANAQLVAAVATYQTHKIKEIAAANLVAFWKFNGNANDSSGNNHNGTLTAGHPYFGAGMPTLTADRFGRAGMAYHFDNGGNIEVPYNAALNPQQMTITAWVKKSLPVTRTLSLDTYTILSLNRWNGYKLQYQSANKIFYTVKAVNGTDTLFHDRDDEVAVLDNDVWYHVAVTFKPDTMKFYVGGDLVMTYPDALGKRATPGNAITVTDATNFVIGQDLPTSKYSTDVNDGNHYVNYGGFFTGDMDDVLIYNTALDRTQIHSIFLNQNTL